MSWVNFFVINAALKETTNDFLLQSHSFRTLSILQIFAPNKLERVDSKISKLKNSLWAKSLTINDNNPIYTLETRRLFDTMEIETWSYSAFNRWLWWEGALELQKSVFSISADPRPFYPCHDPLRSLISFAADFFVDGDYSHSRALQTSTKPTYDQLKHESVMPSFETSHAANRTRWVLPEHAFLQ